jgi:hypothetical protein
MMDNTPSPLSNVITVDDDRIKNHRTTSTGRREAAWRTR